MFCGVSKFMYVTAFIRGLLLGEPISRIAPHRCQNDHSLADFNQTNEHVFPAQAETLVQSVWAIAL